jgi:hypothetical protein
MALETSGGHEKLVLQPHGLGPLRSPLDECLFNNGFDHP